MRNAKGIGATGHRAIVFRTCDITASGSREGKHKSGEDKQLRAWHGDSGRISGVVFRMQPRPRPIVILCLFHILNCRFCIQEAGFISEPLAAGQAEVQL